MKWEYVLVVIMAFLWKFILVAFNFGTESLILYLLECISFGIWKLEPCSKRSISLENGIGNDLNLEGGGQGGY